MQRIDSNEAPPAGTPCGICGRRPEYRVELNDGHSASFCPSCDFMTTDYLPDPVQMEEANRKNYNPRSRISIHVLRSGEFKDRYARILEWIRRHSPGGIRTLLEIGSNIGTFSAHVMKSGIRVDTVEVNDELRIQQMLLYGTPGYKSLSEIPPGRKFDGIVLMDVLEHIPGPVNYLSHLKDFLENDGILFVQVPNKNSWIARAAGKRWGWWLAPDHLYHFSGKALTRAADMAGFHVDRLRYVSPVLDDIEGIPVVGRLFSPVRVLSRWVNPNPLVEFRGGSLVQAILRTR